MPEFQVLQAVLPGFGRAELHDLLRIIHGNDFLAPPRQQFTQQSFARAQVGHRQRRQNPQQQMAKCFPGSPRTIDTVESAGHLVEIDLRLFVPPADDPPEIGLVSRVFLQLGGATNRQAHELRQLAIPLLVQLVEGALAIPSGPEHAGVLQVAEVSGDARLPHARDFLDFIHRKLLLFQQGNDPKPAGIR